MKKKIIVISILIILFLVAGFVVWNTRTTSTIMLDINPSIKITLNKDNMVKRVIPVNDDAKNIITNNLNGKSLEESLSIITDNVIKKGYVEEDRVVIIVHSEGKINNSTISEKIIRNFDEKQIATDIIIVDNITKKDKELAKKYHVSPSKAAYINTIKEENSNVPLESIINSSVNELKDTKENGSYCSDGYTLRGNSCEKEIGRENATPGIVCPNGYLEYNDKCYREGRSVETGELKCPDDSFKLTEEKCEKVDTINAEPIYECTIGELMQKGDVSPIGANDNNKYYCVDKSTAKAPTLRCLLGPHIMIDGKCYVGPAPTINGGCPNNDTLVGGGCYSLDPGDQWQCPNGAIYEKSKNTYTELCPDTFTYREPTITGYKCPEDYKQEDKKCTNKAINDPIRVTTCETGHKLTDNGRCIIESDTKSKVDGYVCADDRARIIGNECIIYDIIEARR